MIALDEGFKVTIWRPAANTHHDSYWATGHDTGHNTDHDTDHAADKAKLVFREISNLTHRLVLVISGEMSRQELMDKLELKVKSLLILSVFSGNKSGGILINGS